MKHITTPTCAFKILQGDELSGRRVVNFHFYAYQKDYRMDVGQQCEFFLWITIYIKAVYHMKLTA